MRISSYQLDVLQELINIGVGRAASMLNRMVDTHIQLQVPELTILSLSDLIDHYQAKNDDNFAAVKLAFTGGFSGTSALLFPPDSAAKLVSIIIGQDELPLDMDSLRIGTLQEVGNIVLNGVMGSLGNILKEHILYSPLDYYEGDFFHFLHAHGLGDSMVLLARTSFNLEEHSIGGDIIILFQFGAFDSLMQAINRLAPAVDLSTPPADSI